MSRVTDRPEAIIRLGGVTEADIAACVPITPLLRQISRIIRHGPIQQHLADAPVPISNSPGANLDRLWDFYLAQSADPDARAVLEAFNALPKYFARILPIEAFCIKAKVPTLRILEILTGVCVRLGAQASTIIAAVNHPRVVQKTVEMALRDEGIEDRTILHKATGFLPTPKTAQTSINITQNQAQQAAAASPPAPVVAPPPEQTIRRIADRFNEARSLPPSSAMPPLLLDAPVPQREAIPVEAIIEPHAEAEGEEEEDEMPT